MKICWDMLEGVRLTINGFFRKGSDIYIYKDSCVKCGDPYLTIKSAQSGFCGRSCSRSGENNHYYGKKFSEEHKKKISTATKGKNNPMYGMAGVLSSNYKGGVTKMGLTTYDTHKNTLGLYEDIRKQEGTGVLEVKCAYCGQWYSPTCCSVNHRLFVINSLNKGEGRLYCSENCKTSCPTYGMHQYPKDFKKATSREVSTYLRQMVFERDNWVCQKCGKTIENVALHCHHIKGYAQNKILANDADNCITLCKECHKEVHKQKGCRYVDLRCK